MDPRNISKTIGSLSENFYPNNTSSSIRNDRFFQNQESSQDILLNPAREEVMISQTRETLSEGYKQYHTLIERNPSYEKSPNNKEQEEDIPSTSNDIFEKNKKKRSLEIIEDRNICDAEIFFKKKKYFVNEKEKIGLNKELEPKLSLDLACDIPIGFGSSSKSTIDKNHSTSTNLGDILSQIQNHPGFFYLHEHDINVIKESVYDDCFIWNNDMHELYKHPQKDPIFECISLLDVPNIKSDNRSPYSRMMPYILRGKSLSLSDMFCFDRELAKKNGILFSRTLLSQIKESSIAFNTFSRIIYSFMWKTKSQELSRLSRLISNEGSLGYFRWKNEIKKMFSSMFKEYTPSILSKNNLDRNMKIVNNSLTINLLDVAQVSFSYMMQKFFSEIIPKSFMKITHNGKENIFLISESLLERIDLIKCMAYKCIRSNREIKRIGESGKIESLISFVEISKKHLYRSEDNLFKFVKSYNLVYGQTEDMKDIFVLEKKSIEKANDEEKKNLSHFLEEIENSNCMDSNFLSQRNIFLFSLKEIYNNEYNKKNNMSKKLELYSE